MKRFAYLAVTGLLAAGAVAGSAASASAGSISSSCSTSGDTTGPDCGVTLAVGGPVTVTLTITSRPGGTVFVAWVTGCSSDNAVKQKQWTIKTTTPVKNTISVNFPQNKGCYVQAAGALSPAGSMRVSLSSRPGPFPGIKGYANLCADDTGNSITAGNKIVTWACHGGAAQQWTFSRSELVHRGMCMSDMAAKVVLNKCNGASNELWTHNSRGEYVLKAHAGTLCLDDPAYARQNGTQLVVYTCHATANQRWTLP